MLNNFSRQKRNLFFTIETKILGSPKNGFFPKGLNHAFGQEMPIFSLFVFAENKTRNQV